MQISIKHQQVKRAVSFGLVIVCAIAFSGCSAIERAISIFKPDITFDEFVEKLPSELLSGSSFDVNFLFEHPENYGIATELPEYSIPSLKGYKEDNEHTKKLLKQLEGYDYNKLSDTQRLTYSIVERSLDSALLMEDYYYLNTSYLGSYLGFQAQLPLLLRDYHFNDKNDVEGYFHLLETTEEAFISYAKHEKERQAEGVGMNKRILDKTIAQCENIVKVKDSFLIDSFNEKIDGISFFTDAEKTQAKEKNERLVQEEFYPSYTALKNELSDIVSVIPDGGLCNLPRGADYYERSVKAKTGVDMSIEEIREFLAKQYEESTDIFFAIAKENPEALKMVESGKVVFSEHKTPEETIDYLEERVKSDFPAIPKLNYTMTPVPPTMKDNFSPAAYLSSRIDAPVTAKESMYINGEYNQGLFSTMMHEAYPGHMYQSVYYKSLNRPAVEDILATQGYHEGWATYVESLSAEYTPLNPDAVALQQANQEASWCILGLMDIEINLDGMSRELYAETYSDWMFGGDKENCSLQYDLFIEDPGNYLAYFVPGLKLIEMRRYAEEQLKDSFSLMEFNKLVLDSGPVPISVMEERLNGYVVTKAGENSLPVSSEVDNKAA